MRSEDYVGANVRSVLARKLFGEGDHADLAQAAAEHDVEPLIICQSLRIAQVSHNAAADRHVAVASGAVSLEESLAVLYRRFIGRRGRGIERRLFIFRHWRKARFPAEFESQHPADISDASRFECDLAGNQREDTAPTRQHSDVLLALYGVGHRARHHAGLGVE